jgi:hypothetical protein
VLWNVIKRYFVWLTAALLLFFGGDAVAVSGFCIATKAPVKCKLSNTIGTQVSKTELATS